MNEELDNNNWGYETEDQFDGQSWVFSIVAIAATQLEGEIGNPARCKVGFNEGTTSEYRRELVNELESLLKKIYKESKN
jgi:hypothetical protein